MAHSPYFRERAQLSGASGWGPWHVHNRPQDDAKAQRFSSREPETAWASFVLQLSSIPHDFTVDLMKNFGDFYTVPDRSMSFFGVTFYQTFPAHTPAQGIPTTAPTCLSHYSCRRHGCPPGCLAKMKARWKMAVMMRTCYATAGWRLQRCSGVGALAPGCR